MVALRNAININGMAPVSMQYILKASITMITLVKGTRGVQHGVWTRLHSFLIIMKSIDIVKVTNGGQHEK